MRYSVASLLLACLTLTGCATIEIGAHQPSAETVTLLRSSGIATLNAGEFKLAPEAKPSLDQSVSVRTNTVKSPTNDSFAAYLKESLIADLKSAGKFDTGSPIVVSGQLVESELNSGGANTADAKLAAKFQVTRNGQQVYDKLLTAEHQWESAFIGAVAIPRAISEYTEMYSKLLMKLFSDAEFQSAAK